MDGYELAGRIKVLFPAVRLIALTGWRKLVPHRFGDQMKDLYSVDRLFQGKAAPFYRLTTCQGSLEVMLSQQA